jgi:hypothetical protein
MPDAWSDKDERQYEHIVESQKMRGRSKRRAKEVAARTVNKKRRQQGRVASEKSRATGNPNTRLEERSKEELMNRAAELKITGRSRMGKQELIVAIRDHR